MDNYYKVWALDITIILRHSIYPFKPNNKRVSSGGNISHNTPEREEEDGSLIFKRRSCKTKTSLGYWTRFRMNKSSHATATSSPFFE